MTGKDADPSTCNNTRDDVSSTHNTVHFLQGLIGFLKKYSRSAHIFSLFYHQHRRETMRIAFPAVAFLLSNGAEAFQPHFRLMAKNPSDISLRARNDLSEFNHLFDEGSLSSLEAAATPSKVQVRLPLRSVATLISTRCRDIDSSAAHAQRRRAARVGPSPPRTPPA